jgi:hypothetical protein
MLHTVPPDGAVNLCWLPPGRFVIMRPRVTALHARARGARMCRCAASAQSSGTAACDEREIDG